MSQLTYFFRSAPHATASGREGIDALMAASAYCESIAVIFSGDGVYQLLQGQQASDILCKEYAPMMKLFELYDIEDVFVCAASLSERGLSHADLIIDAKPLSVSEIQAQLAKASALLSF